MDNRGEIINYSRSFPAPKINIADRDYFLNAQLGYGEGTFYSIPVQNRFNQSWIFYLSRRISNSKGEFLGLIIVGISSKIFSKFYEIVATNLGPGASITLYRRDFTVMTLWLFIPNMIGQKRADSTTMKIIDDLKLTNGVILTDEPSSSGLLPA